MDITAKPRCAYNRLALWAWPQFPRTSLLFSRQKFGFKDAKLRNMRSVEASQTGGHELRGRRGEGGSSVCFCLSALLFVGHVSTSSANHAGVGDRPTSHFSEDYN
jgi:hypothetical protein